MQFLGTLGALLATLGPLWGPPGALLGLPGALLEPPGPLLGSILPSRGSLLGAFWTSPCEIEEASKFVDRMAFFEGFSRSRGAPKSLENRFWAAQLGYMRLKWRYMGPKLGYIGPK